jgi:hypothetical protein
MIGALKQVEAGRAVEDVAREVGVSKHTLYAWKAKYGGMDVSQAHEANWYLRKRSTAPAWRRGKCAFPAEEIRHRSFGAFVGPPAKGLRCVLEDIQRLFG